ncbi:MAG TPA: hypothetical protein VFN68_09275 [Acidimicrobiales bacterium]|nr:hypothetical protein [Acidimicrobiales bacterium]
MTGPGPAAAGCGSEAAGSGSAAAGSGSAAAGCGSAAAGSGAAGPPDDAQYERMHRRLARRAAGLSLVCILVGVAAVFAVSGGAGPAPGLVARLAVPVPGSATDGCSAGDLAKPALISMPSPQVVTSPVTIRPAPDVERLSPPDTQPVVTARRAWSLMRTHKDLVPSSAGSTQVLLGDLYAATPAVVEPGRPARPVFTHTLVWAIYGRHQPEAPAAGTSDSPPCYFESTVFYVDATTGRPLVAEVFPPATHPSSQA